MFAAALLRPLVLSSLWYVLTRLKVYMYVHQLTEYWLNTTHISEQSVNE